MIQILRRRVKLTCKSKSILAITTLIAANSVFRTHAYADVILVSTPTVRIDAYLDSGAVSLVNPNANFGAGSLTAGGGGSVLNHTPASGEAYIKPGIDASYNIGNISFYGAVSTIAAKTLGDGDFEQYSQTGGQPFSILLEDLYFGVKTPLPFGGNDDTLVIQGGRQPFQIDDGFLVGRGTYNTGNRAAWWYSPRFDFSGPGVIKFNGDPVRADVFVLESNSNAVLTNGYDRPETKFAGFDLSWFIDRPKLDGSTKYANRSTYATLTYYKIYEADNSVTYNGSARADRDQMNVYSLAFGGNVLPVHKFNLDEDFTLYGNYVGEYNNHAGQGFQKVNAYGYYVEPGYTFSQAPWTPRIFYRRTTYSGQSNPNGTVKRSYDPMFLYNGSRQFFGGFFPGEIVGEYDVVYSGLDINQVGITAVPPVHLLKSTDQLKLNLEYYNINLNHPAQYGVGQGSRHFSDEIDFATEYTYSPTLSGAALFGVAFPGKAGQENIASYQPAMEREPHVGGNTFILEAYIYKRF